MINSMLWLRYGQQVMPGIFTFRNSLRHAFLLGVSCYLFLIIFQPFGTYNFEDSGKYFLLAGYGVIFAFSYLLASILLSNEKKWTVRTELSRMLLVYLSATIFNFLYNSCIVSQVPLKWINLLYMGLYTISLYVPIGLIYFLTLIKTNWKKSNITAPNAAALPQLSLTGQRAFVVDKSPIVCVANGSQLLCFGRQDFIFAKSMDNYCEAYFYEDKIVKKEIIRITLGKLAEQLMGADIHRCHRSYLVNFDKILTKEGNAKGFLLRFADTEEYALVSRSMLPAVKSYLLS